MDIQIKSWEGCAHVSFYACDDKHIHQLWLTFDPRGLWYEPLYICPLRFCDRQHPETAVVRHAVAGMSSGKLSMESRHMPHTGLSGTSWSFVSLPVSFIKSSRAKVRLLPHRSSLPCLTSRTPPALPLELSHPGNLISETILCFPASHDCNRTRRKANLSQCLELARNILLRNSSFPMWRSTGLVNFAQMIDMKACATSCMLVPSRLRTKISYTNC